MRMFIAAEAARREEKGYSAVEERALRNYFEGPATTKAEIARQRWGCEKGQTTADAERRRVAAVRGNWRSGKET
ncbi:MAG: hypothetical protein ACLFPV_05410 [Spirochaetaceae bacterium]